MATTFYSFTLFGSVLFLLVGMCDAQTPNQGGAEEEPHGYWNWSTPTMGGRQFWTDVRHLDGWRIQHNHVTGHYRLLDPGQTRRAWGNLPHCQLKLDEVAKTAGLKPYSGKVVVLLHGLVRSHASMEPLGQHLKKAGYQVVNLQYASSRATIGDHAEALERIIEGLGDEVTEINFVGHSMGNLVVRHYLHNTGEKNGGQQGDDRIHRMVMLGPPNQGSRMARLMKYSLVFQLATGAAGTQLSSTWDRLEPRLAVPEFEFGIIAGGQEEGSVVSNYLLDGKDDFTVSVEETKLEGAHDFAVRPMLHGGMMKQPETLELTLRFLKHGYFVDETHRQPIQGTDHRE